jgi:hypothetical protein
MTATQARSRIRVLRLPVLLACSRARCARLVMITQSARSLWWHSPASSAALGYPWSQVYRVSVKES